MQGIKQEALADTLGNGWNQKRISLLESTEQIDGGTLDEVAKALKVPGDVLKNLDVEEAIVNIQNNYDHATAKQNYQYYSCTFNPLDKYVEAMEENKRLYEALLKEKDEKIALLLKNQK